MIHVLKSLFEHTPQESEESRERNLRLAAAALLVETARADFDESSIEMSKLAQLLPTVLELEPAEVHNLVTAAQERVEDATSLYEFTRVINEGWSLDQKVALVSAMWAVAYADGDVDKYEEHLIRNVADLIYVPHSDYIHCKLTAQM
ncbi:MAG: TerB family tellurite resistance protein [Halioglobus sp.]|nr:TerB family tellurite resistance protein [Halioglobus sp.]